MSHFNVFLKSLFSTSLVLAGFSFSGCGDDPHQYTTPPPDYEENSPGSLQASTPKPTQKAKDATSTLTAGKNFHHPELPLEMIWVKPGSFRMGSKSANAPKNEKPNAIITVTQGYWLAKHETTQRLFEAVMSENPSDFHNAEQPVESLAYYEALDFCEKLTAQERSNNRLQPGFQYHLPTETQWEFAAKGGAEAHLQNFPQIEESVWHKGNSPVGPNIVGRKTAHPLGFLDLLGNISELCYGRAAPLPSLPQKDWIGSQEGRLCVARGGNWFEEPTKCTTTARLTVLPSTRNSAIGFRLALSNILQSQ